MVSQNQRLESLKKGWMYGLRTHHGDWQVGFHLGFWRGGPLLDVAFAGGYICFNLKDPKAQKEVLVCAASLLKTADKWKWYQNEHAVHLGFVCANPIPQPNNAAILRGVLQPVLNSMQDFHRTFDFPWDVQTFEQDTLPAKID